MARVFKTTLMEPLHNLTGVLPISYMLNKVMHSYSIKLQDTAPTTKTQLSYTKISASTDLSTYNLTQISCELSLNQQSRCTSPSAQPLQGHGVSQDSVTYQYPNLISYHFIKNALWTVTHTPYISWFCHTYTIPNPSHSTSASLGGIQYTQAVLRVLITHRPYAEQSTMPCSLPYLYMKVQPSYGYNPEPYLTKYLCLHPIGTHT
jgi:hypothetical protein